jgi:hypothetical protein
MQRIILTIVLVAFSVVSGIALWNHGFWGIIAPHFKSFGGGQVLFDLVIAVSLTLTWMTKELRASGRNPWPWIAFTLVTGSFGPLLYLLTRKPAVR